MGLFQLEAELSPISRNILMGARWLITQYINNEINSEITQ